MADSSYDHDERNLSEWVDFLTDYASGHFTLSRRDPPSLPCSVERTIDEYDFDKPIYETVEITPRVARRVREFYSTNKFLPPPRPPLEVLRERIISEYNLYSTKQMENIQAAIDLVQAFFGGITTFTLFKHSQQEFMAVAGPPEVLKAVGLYPGMRVLPETSLCGHSILFKGKESVYIQNLAADWRTNGNPYCDEMKGIKSYVGNVISLNIDPASTTDDRLVGVGVINNMHLDNYLPPLKEEQEKILGHVSRMLETQLRATWEGHSRTREARARRAVSDFIESTLVGSTLNDAASTASRAEDGPEFEKEDIGLEDLEVYARLAANQIKGVLDELDTVGIVDLRSLQSVEQSTGQVIYAMSPDAIVDHLPTLAWDSANEQPTLPINELSSIISDLLIRYRRNMAVVPDAASPGAGLASYLKDNSTHITLPFFAGDHPLFLIIVSTSQPYYTFRASDMNFIRSMGVVLRARIIQSRVIEADAAKTTFLSSISHELRTPLHGILSSMELLRDAVEKNDLGVIRDLLGMAESSAETLDQILNDTLDFGRLSQGREIGSRVKSKDLIDLLLSVVRLCLPRIKRDGKERVQVVVKAEPRDWNVQVDEVALQRIMLNALTNAIKFTTSGTITLSLSTTAEGIIFQTKDSGPGISPLFLSKAFEPFTKADSFSPGAGLGLFISRTLAERMGGTITLSSRVDGVSGAVFEAVLPIHVQGAKGGVALQEVPLSPLQSKRVDTNGGVSLTERSEGSSVKEPREPRVEGEIVDPMERSKLKIDDPMERLKLKIDDPTLPCSPPTSKDKFTLNTMRSDISIETVSESTSLGSSLVSNSRNTIGSTTSLESDGSVPKPNATVKILAVDDNDISRKLLLAMLKKTSKQIPIVLESAINGQEALEKFKSFRPDLVLTDVSMPIMDGITSAAGMREFERSLLFKGEGGRLSRIYAITGLGSSDPRLKTDALLGLANLDGWLIKGQDKLDRIKEIVQGVYSEIEG